MPRKSATKELDKAVEDIIETANAQGKTLLRARVIYRTAAGSSFEQPIILRRIGSHELRPLEAAWRLERLDERGKKVGRYFWYDYTGKRV